LLKSLPIRLRLTLLYGVVFASAGLLLSLANWWMLHRSVDATEYHDLQERAQDVQLLLEHRDPNQSLESFQKSLKQMYEFKDDGKWLQILDQDGHWLYRSSRMIAENPPLPFPGNLPKDGVIAEFDQNGHRVRILAYPIQANGRSYSVQAGMSLKRSMLLLNQFRIDLLLLTPAVLLLAAAGGHLMSRTALKPVAALAIEARRINDRNLDTRLPISEANDELSHLSETLNQMLERIDKAFGSVRAFTGNASHELRTSISLLRTEIEVALHRPRPALEYRETLERLQNETQRMTTLIENLMALARADSGAETVKAEVIDVSQMMRQTEQTWRVSMQHALLEFRVEAADGLFILAEPVSMRRLLSILLENACRYTLPGGAVTLRAETEEDSVILSVRDTGIGIAAEHLPKIFDRFYRVVHQHESVQNGSGLGLALARWIADRHGASLEVESDPGSGSLFSLRIARCNVDELQSRITEICQG
jgi:two-component system, OmpR family, heavy metal sensor histidine kinase CusS